MIKLKDISCVTFALMKVKMISSLFQILFLCGITRYWTLLCSIVFRKSKNVYHWPGNQPGLAFTLRWQNSQITTFIQHSHVSALL